jgi:hypothetical protein
VAWSSSVWFNLPRDAMASVVNERKKGYWAHGGCIGGEARFRLWLKRSWCCCLLLSPPLVRSPPARWLRMSSWHQSLPEAFKPGAVVRSPWDWGKGRACSLHLGDNVVLQTESQDHHPRGQR